MEMDMVDENAPLRKKRAKKFFVCQICSKSFKDNYKLKRHKKVHIRSGEIPEQGYYNTGWFNLEIRSRAVF